MKWCFCTDVNDIILDIKMISTSPQSARFGDLRSNVNPTAHLTWASYRLEIDAKI